MTHDSEKNTNPAKSKIPRARELKAWAVKWNLEDRWWCSSQGKVFGPYSIDEIDQRCNLLPRKRMLVIHVISSENPEMKWIEMEASSYVAPDEPETDLNEFKITAKINLQAKDEEASSP